MWWLSLKAMLADRSKLVTGLLGVAFSVALINLQGGLLLGMLQKASQLVDYGQADIWVGHRHMSNVEVTNYIPERWVHRIRALEGVERAEPYLVTFSQATMPDGRFEIVLVVGSEPSSLLGNAWVMADGDPNAIRHPDAILVDAYDTDRLGDCRVGDIREINGRRARVVGLTRGIVGFTSNPYVFTTLDRARNKYVTGVRPDDCSYFLVKARPGTDLALLSQRIRERVPEVDVYTRSEFAYKAMMYWMTRTGIGISFSLAAFLGLLVGLAVVAQTMYASVSERLREFATLKAMGAADSCLAQFLIAQAGGNAVVGSLLGLATSLTIGQVMSTPRAPVMLTWPVAAASVLLMVVVCLLAAWLPYRRVQRLDPASVLRS